MKCIGPQAKGADVWIIVWEEVRHQEGTLVEVEHVKAHRSQTEKQEMTFFESRKATRGRISW